MDDIFQHRWDLIRLRGQILPENFVGNAAFDLLLVSFVHTDAVMKRGSETNFTNRPNMEIPLYDTKRSPFLVLTLQVVQILNIP